MVISRGHKEGVFDQLAVGGVRRPIAVKNALAGSSEAVDDADNWSYAGDPSRGPNTGKIILYHSVSIVRYKFTYSELL